MFHSSNVRTLICNAKNIKNVGGAKTTPAGAAIALFGVVFFVAFLFDAYKTDGGEWVSSYECDVMTADAEFLLSKQRYTALTGREQERGSVTARRATRKNLRLYTRGKTEMQSLVTARSNVQRLLNITAGTERERGVPTL